MNDREKLEEIKEAYNYPHNNKDGYPYWMIKRVEELLEDKITKPEKGDIVVFEDRYDTREGKIVKVYDDNYVKIRSFVLFLPQYHIDTMTNMLSHRKRVK